MSMILSSTTVSSTKADVTPQPGCDAHLLLLLLLVCLLFSLLEAPFGLTEGGTFVIVPLDLTVNSITGECRF